MIGASHIRQTISHSTPAFSWLIIYSMEQKKNSSKEYKRKRAELQAKYRMLFPTYLNMILQSHNLICHRRCMSLAGDGSSWLDDIGSLDQA